MAIYKYIIFFCFLIFSCEKDDSVDVELIGQLNLSLCGSSEFNKQTISVLSFNRLKTSSLNSFSKVVETLNPDIIGVQESYQVGLEIADRFNYCFYGNTENSVSILSKYPIDGINEFYSKIILNDSTYLNFFNVHFTAFPYQPYDIRDTLITTVSQARYQAEQVRGLESTMLVSLIGETENKEFSSQNNMPIIVTGDFNEPSHLDWILGAENPMSFQISDAGSQFIVNWPASNKILDAGLIDTYRELYPDPIENTGYTWTPQNSLNEVHDRIDFIYYKGYSRINVNSVYIIGPDHFSNIIIDDYESDHRGVFTIFNIDI